VILPIPDLVREINEIAHCRPYRYVSPYGHQYIVYGVELDRFGRVTAETVDPESGVTTFWDAEPHQVRDIHRWRA
jgi:hypothetical protein